MEALHAVLDDMHSNKPSLMVNISGNSTLSSSLSGSKQDKQQIIMHLTTTQYKKKLLHIQCLYACMLRPKQI